ncbi:Retrovirus-related Pol polyprotein from transposon 17.6 [Dictyocoela muelleri]|nr:Retrovirus-related Pol polyprotein from transposon 17.6 [Dictyocoela muelleri]
MPFGLVNAPRAFQKCMNELFTNLEFVRIFLDDISIFSNSIESHKEPLNEVIKILNMAGASINFENSRFCQNKVIYLGNIIPENGIKPNISRIDKLKDFKTSNSYKDIMKLVGFINLFSPYITNSSEKLVQLQTNFLKKYLSNRIIQTLQLLKKFIKILKAKHYLHYLIIMIPFKLQQMLLI